MQLFLSAGGAPDTIRAHLREQVDRALGTAPDLKKAAVAAAVLEYVHAEIARAAQSATPGLSSVSVSLTISIAATG